MFCVVLVRLSSSPQFLQSRAIFTKGLTITFVDSLKHFCTSHFTFSSLYEVAFLFYICITTSCSSRAVDPHFSIFSALVVMVSLLPFNSGSLPSQGSKLVYKMNGTGHLTRRPFDSDEDDIKILFKSYNCRMMFSSRYYNI